MSSTNSRLARQRQRSRLTWPESHADDATLASGALGGAPHHPADLQVLAAWAPELADTFVALACDIALVIDTDGRIAKLAQH